MKDPAFLFYTNDFQGGTIDMSCEEVGAYLRLLMYQHQHDKIPNNKERLMRITGIFSEEKFDVVSYNDFGRKFSWMEMGLFGFSLESRGRSPGRKGSLCERS